MFNLLIWATVQLLLFWLLEGLTRGYRNRKFYKAIFFPAMAFEGLVRLAACFASAKPVEKIEFLEDQKPFLRDGKSRIPYFGSAIFLSLWMLALFLAFYSWASRIEGLEVTSLTLPHLDAEAISNGYIYVDVRSYLHGLESIFRTMPWTSLELWLFLYLAIGLFPFAGLTLDQLKCGGLIVIVLGLFAGAINYLGIRPGFLSRGWYLTNWVLPEFFSVYSFFLTLLGFTLFLHMAAKMTRRAAHAWLARAAAKPQTEKSPKSKRHLQASH